jgi:hypothetical protein
MSRIPVSRLVLLASVLTLIVAVAPSLAAKKPQGPTLSAPALKGTTTGTSYTLTGSGFEPGQLVLLNVAEANGCCVALYAVADTTGSFTYTGNVWASGTYSVRAAVLEKQQWRFVADWSYQAS